jgi:hypothetical protein
LKQRIIIITVLFLLLITPFCKVANAANYEIEFKLVNHPGGTVQYGLTVSITSSLYNYYVDRNHDLYSSTDFAKFITPYSVKPIADVMRNVYSNDEVFADAVLGIAHQIPYEVSPEVYPVETLKLNSGDCGSFSLLIASILKAGGLDVVLLEYTSLQHLNIGVNLPNKPTYVRSNLYWIDYNSKRYYIAETTGDNFPNGWRVGECPQELKETSPNIIAVENSEQQQPGQVAASYKTLTPSQISISTSTSFAMENGVITIAGLVSPAKAGNVSLYVSTFAGAWQILATVSIGSDGKYLYQWRPQAGGIYNLQASWSGNENYAGADSSAVVLYIIPFYGLIAGVLALLLLVLVVAFMLMNRRGTATPPPPEPLQKNEPPPPPPPAEPLPQATEETQKPPEETQPSPQPQQSQTPEETTQTQETQQSAEQSTQTSDQSPQPQTEQPSQPITEETAQPPTEETTQAQPPAEETPPPQPAPQTTPEPQQTEPTTQPPQQPTPASPNEEQPQPETPTQQESTQENPTTQNP